MKKCSSIGLLLVFGGLPLVAQDRGFLQTGSISEAQYDLGFGPEVSRRTTTNAFDGHGNVVQSTSTSSRTDREIYAFESSTWTYDHRDRPALCVTENDWDADGTTDRSSTTTYTYDNRNLTETLTTFTASDGTITGTDTTSYTYYDHDNSLLIVEEFDTSGVHSRFVTSITNDYPNDLQYVVGVGFNADGTVGYTSKTVTTLDERHRQVSSVFEVEPDGISGTMSYTYDKFGNFIQSRTELLFPDGQGGLAAETITSTYFYAHRGEIIRNSVSASGFFYYEQNRWSRPPDFRIRLDCKTRPHHPWEAGPGSRIGIWSPPGRDFDTTLSLSMCQTPPSLAQAYMDALQAPSRSNVLGKF